MGRVASADGLSLHAEAHGSGPPILFSCPLNTTCENWRPQVTPLVAAGLRVVLWDYRGHGRSDAPADPTGYAIERVVDDLVVNMVDVGEETGELDTMLYKVADTYDEEVAVLTESLVSLMEPLLIVFLGGAVGFIVVALFMPLVSLITNLSK